MTPFRSMRNRSTGRTGSSIDKSGKSHILLSMPVLSKSRAKQKIAEKKGITVVEQYDTAADNKKRISLRGAQAKYFHVKALSNGGYLLEPRILVPRDAIPARTLRMIEQSALNLKKGKASTAIDLSAFSEE